MDKASKLLFQKDVEKYLESKGVYDIFEDLLKSVLISKPNDPIDHMIQKLNEPEHQRIFIVGPPGSHVRELALQFGLFLGITQCSSVGDLLSKEISKKTDIGKRIEGHLQNLKYVPDDIVIDLVKKQINTFEKEKKAFILEGFPKTRSQGLSLQKEGIIPDTFLLLDLPHDEIVQCVERKIGNADGKWSQHRGDKKVPEDCATEYELNIKQVKQIYNHYYFQIDARNNEESLLEEMARLVKYKIKRHTPKRSSRIIVLGPPGSGRTSLSNQICKTFGFVNVNTAHLLADQVNQKTEIGKSIVNLLSNGDLVNDDIINALVTNRLKQDDCQKHGYVLDGFPKTIEQIQLLENLKIQPTVIVILECPDEVTIERLSHKRIDPVTGLEYDINQANLPDEVVKRLQQRPQDQRAALEKRLARWKELLKTIEQQYLSYILRISATNSETNVMEKIAFCLENS